MSSPAVSSRDASRPGSGILTPASEGTLNRYDGIQHTPSEDNKGKRRTSNAMDHLLKESIAVKPHPPNLHVQPRLLQPLMILPREHLPLSCMDLIAPFGEFTQNRFFEAHVKALDLEARMGASRSILIARNDSQTVNYALERQRDGLYVVCRLGRWVDIDALVVHATVVSRNRLTAPAAKPEPQTQAAAEALTTPQTHKAQKKKRAAIEAIQSLVRKRPRSQPASDGSNVQTPAAESTQSTPVIEDVQVFETFATPSQTEPPSSGPPAAEEQIADAQTPKQVADAIFDNIRTHYFDALYRSMGSLAYFAKGPLSRARSAFHLDLESNLDMSDLIEFLRSLVLTTVQIDRKYRETIPELLSTYSKPEESSDDGRKKKRRARKMKLGRDGLYPTEDDTIRQWWGANKPKLREGEFRVSTERIRSHASLLRTRETELQIILILEILALEPLQASKEVLDANLPMLPGASDSQEQMPPPAKKRNKHNLPVLVDVHADRLTIWQSTASEELLLLEDTQLIQSIEGHSLQMASSEPLKDFCVDVIVPFFSARLPELCDAINRKLGGPLIMSPPKPKSSKRSSSQREQKPGAAAKRPGLSKTPRTLQRALSTDLQHRRSVSRGPSNAIALMRSATSTSLSGLKREDSDTSVLGSLPKKDADTAAKGSGSLCRRNSVNIVGNSKANKKAMVDAELRDAISALRKPNRQVVGKALAEDAERKATTALHSRKPTKHNRTTLSTIQVEATPTNNRFRDMMAPGHGIESKFSSASKEEAIPPSSVGTAIPSTAPRNGRVDVFSSGGRTQRDVVGNTPLRPPAQQSDLFSRHDADDCAIPPLSPLVARRRGPNWLQTQKPRRHTWEDSGEGQVLEDGHQRTPMKIITPFTTNGQREAHTTASEQREAKMTIYEKLGWDDELDDL